MANKLAPAMLALAAVLLASNADAGSCYPPLGGGAENVAWAWGSNSNGQLGDGTTAERDTPVEVQNLRGLLTIAAGGGHSLALRNDGTVWAWGWNISGQLGDGTTFDRPTPVQVSNLGGVRCIAGGYQHSLALKSDGTVWAWGWNRYGQLGDSATADRNIPVQVHNLTGVTAIAAGSNASFAIKIDGTLWAWGANVNGELGDGTIIDRHAPVQVQNLSGVTGTATAAYHSLALRNDGTVWAWGANVNGELGDGTNVEHHTPVQVREPLVNAPPELAAPIIGPPRPTRYLIGVKAVAAGTGFSLALKIDGTVRAWGANYFGQLGDNTNSSRGMPVGVPHVSGVVGIAAGEGHSLAFGSNAIVQAWGYNTDGELGDNTQTNHPYAVQAENLVENLSAVTAVDGGGSHSVTVGPLLTLLTVRKIVMHGAQNRRVAPAAANRATACRGANAVVRLAMRANSRDAAVVRHFETPTSSNEAVRRPAPRHVSGNADIPISSIHGRKRPRPCERI